MASHRRPSQSGLTQSARVTVLSAAAATAAAALGGAPASADPRDTAEATRAKVDRLYEEAEKATEHFNKAGERVETLRERVEQAQDSVARGQERINRMRGALGSVAGAQYRSGGMDPALALLLSGDPDTYLDRAATLDRITERQTTALQDLQRAQRGLGQQRAEATEDLAELERSRVAVARHKRTVEGKLTQARQLLNSLPAEERDAFDRASRSGRGETLPALSGLAPSSSRAAAAVMAARSVVGRPYVWGANGPSGFDCSGLTQWSYAQAGVALPRTSQAQRSAGRQVSLAQAQPGDLVTYGDDAGHIGMYMGNGQVVHAPYPGASVRYDPVGMMPVSSVTRV
ncbi:NlpC/P60 family protein [Streptomyces sp. NBC_01142]|uniref:C40 family peptidase n=1 Tax=Streptomyces sp. NBC_01142 TaxID=2975865 RepID=UPI002253F06E|nr:C40 family peptidase [Streptomyces sp. NBC_01142]MCX4822528.1 NlpC/P60 family protein [Streptomyces sp. NBC_01142]